MTKSVSFSSEKPNVVDWVDRKQLSEWESEDNQIALQRARDEGCTCAIISLRLRMDVEDLIEEDTKERRLFDKIIKDDLAAALTAHDGLTVTVMAVRLGTENVLVSLVCSNGTVMGAVDELDKQARNPVSTLRKGRLTKSMMGALAAEYELIDPDSPSATTCFTAGDEEVDDEPDSNPILRKVVDSRVVKKRKENIDLFEEDPPVDLQTGVAAAPAGVNTTLSSNSTAVIPAEAAKGISTEGEPTPALSKMRAENEKVCAEWAKRVEIAETRADEAERKVATLEAKNEADRETILKQVGEFRAEPPALYARILELEEQVAKQNEEATRKSSKSLTSKFTGFFGDSADESDPENDDSMFGGFFTSRINEDRQKDKSRVGAEPTAPATENTEGTENTEDKQAKEDNEDKEDMEENDLMAKFKFW